MNNKKIAYEIYLDYKNVYQVSRDGCVLKFSNGLDKTKASINDLKSWQIIGLREKLPFGNVGNLITIEKAATLPTLLFKNGNPKYFLIDKDHGTQRLIMGSQYSTLKISKI